MKKKTVCNCWFDSKHWKLGAHSVSLFSPWLPHHEAPSYPSRSLTSHPRVSRRDQAKPGPACLEGWRLHQSTYILRFTHGFLLGRTVNVARLPLPLYFTVSLFSPASSAFPSWQSAGEESSLSTQASKLCWPLTPWRFTHLDATVCSCRQITLGDGRNAFPRHGFKLEKSVQSFLD